MTSGSNVLRSFSRWFKSIYGGSDRPFFNYRSWVNETIQQLRWQTTQYFYCTQFGSGRLVTSENGFKNVFPNVVTEQYYDQWCTDIFGVRCVETGDEFVDTMKNIFTLVLISLRNKGIIEHSWNALVRTSICSMVAVHNS